MIRGRDKARFVVPMLVTAKVLVMAPVPTSAGPKSVPFADFKAIAEQNQRCVIIDVGDGDIGGVDSLVSEVGTGRGTQHDCVSKVTVDCRIVGSSDRRHR